MSTQPYSDGAAGRIAHIKSHLDSGFRLDRAVHNIENNLGDPHACALHLSSHALASAMFAWFQSRDLEAMKQWCYVAARLDQQAYRMEVDTNGPRGYMLGLLTPLLSDHAALIDWFPHYEGAYDLKRVENHKTRDFFAYQAVLALRGDWDRLITRCTQVIDDPPGAHKEQKYLLDHHFYLALARADIDGMNSTLQQLVMPKAVQGRSNDESGFTDDLISTAAVIYAKIAWRNGFEVAVDSPYVPPEWLPIAPLERYDLRYRFLKDDR